MPDVFQVLADPTRRRLIDALRHGERSVNELVELVDIGQPGVSRQLAILEDAQFVVVRPEGRRRLYAHRHEGVWLTVNTPKDLRVAEEYMAANPDWWTKGNL